MSVRTHPLLTLRDIVVMPGMVVPLFVGRKKSILALEAAVSRGNQIFLATQKNIDDDEPGVDAIYKVGVVASILQLLKLPDGTVKVLVEGEYRACNGGFSQTEQFFECRTERLHDKNVGTDLSALTQSLLRQFELFAKHYRRVTPEMVVQISGLKDNDKLVDTIVTHLNVGIKEKQDILETRTLAERMEKVYALIEGQISIAQVEKKIRSRVKRQMEKTQHEYYLSEQMKAIQKELGEDGAKEELDLLAEKAKRTRLSKEARQRFDKELSKLKSMAPASAESSIIRSYLDWILGMPWGKKRRRKSDLEAAMQILDAQHYGLDKVKERIIEFLAVQKRRKSKKTGTILCLVGAPGVGKTSLGRSIAAATGRNFVHISLGGVRDEAEIRGHRRTYIGAMPGKFIQSLRECGTDNPLMVLDEIDKLGSDFRGDPAYALLELLDPEQNKTFRDHYLDLHYDLSNVMFLATSNSLDMPAPLLDRMEVIRMPGYTVNEKMEIAHRHLIPLERASHALGKKEFVINDAVVDTLIHDYTREAGVRNLRREIANIARKSVLRLERGEKPPIHVEKDNLDSFAGPPRFKHTDIEEEDLIGIVNGLAWTPLGGVLLKIEALTMPGDGKVIQTGNLKDVMKESITAAISYIRANAASFDLQPCVFDKHNIHVHIPEGATPKDGPSAGVGMLTAVISLLTRTPVKRTIAMTGEITLRGQVLPIGGLGEKLLGAMRAGVSEVIIPRANQRDLSEVKPEILEALDIFLVDTVPEVLELALAKPHGSLDPAALQKKATAAAALDGGRTRH